MKTEKMFKCEHRTVLHNNVNTVTCSHNKLFNGKAYNIYYNKLWRKKIN